MSEPRGMSLERVFAEWMKSDLGYARTRRRVPVKGKIADRAYEVDIHAEKFSPLWDFLRRLGIFLFALAVLVYFLPTELKEVEVWMQKIVANFDPKLASSALGIFGVVGFVLGFLGKQRATTRVWVECKDTRANVKRAQVQKLAASVHDVRESEEAKWKPDVVILVSGTDFDADALNFAREHSFICYRRSETGFERVE